MATYCIIINLIDDSKIQIGKLGNIEFKKGYYIYVGSALNSIKGRIERHLRNEKKLFWHIDYLLNSPNSRIKDVIFEKSNDKWECEIVEEIAENGTPVNKFGCSDCKCKSHLFYFKNSHAADISCLNAFNKFKLKAEKYSNLIKVEK